MFEFVIVGAGSTRCVLADRLSAGSSIRLRVHGTEGLRAMSASIMPCIPSAVRPLHAA